MNVDHITLEEGNMKRLVIGYDGSECAKDAFRDLRSAGLSGDLDVKLLTIADVWLPATKLSGSDRGEFEGCEGKGGKTLSRVQGNSHCIIGIDNAICLSQADIIIKTNKGSSTSA